MDRRTRIARLSDKEDLMDAVRKASGREPPGLRRMIDLLAQPDVIDLTIGFFDGYKINKHECLIFAAPWDCVLQDEALNETIRSDEWLESGNFEALHEDWCDPCRNRVLEGRD